MRTQQQTKMAALAATLFLAAAEALAQDRQSAVASSDDCGQPVRRIVISIDDRKLALLEDGEVARIYPIAVGANATPSPTGVFKIANRIQHPTWYGPNRNIVPPGKANPLGTRWMGLTRAGYGIHGTNVQSSVGKNVSHGCIRMRKADVEELFQIVKVGDVVEMVSLPTEAMAWIFAAADQAVASAE
jgi:lipoprotein-anchoring transpeptidase ErfK/SrfK